jgi:hypothetical protein
VGGVYDLSGDFTVNGGVTVTVVEGCEFDLEANNINIAGTINATAKGGAGGNGGGLNAGGYGLTCDVNANASVSGGGRGSNGSGIGGGAQPGAASGGDGYGCGQDCGNFNDYAGMVKGGGGSGGGGGGAYGGAGGSAGAGGSGGDISWNNVLTNLGYCSYSFSGGAGSAGGAGGSVYGTDTTFNQIDFGSGGAGAGAGGRGAGNGAPGGPGGRGGGKVILTSRAGVIPYTFTLTGSILANGGDGAGGGAGGVSGRTASDCCGDLCNQIETEEATNVTGGGGGGGGGGGSGGGVMLKIYGNSNLNGIISANGGNGGSGGAGGASSTSTYGGGFLCGGAQSINNGAGTAGGAGGRGGGGRVKIFYNPCFTHVNPPASYVAGASVTVNAGTSGSGAASAGTKHAGFVDTYSPLTTAAITTADYTTCQGGPYTTLSATIPTGGTGTYEYLWYYSSPCAAATTGTGSSPNPGWISTGFTGATLTAAQINLVVGTSHGDFCFQRRNRSGDCYTWTNARTVTVRPTPTATVSGTTAVCQNDPSPAITFTNPMNLPVTVIYNINGGANQTVGVGANSTANISVPTGTAGTFTYNLVSVSYTTSPDCQNPISGSATVTVNPLPAAFTVNQVTALPLCFKGNARIQVPSSQSGISYQLRENTTPVGSPQTGNGSTLVFHTANLTADNANYNVLATTGFGCTLQVNVPLITVENTLNALSNNLENRTCYLYRNNDFVEFRSANGHIVAVNPGNEDLGNVTAQSYVELPVSVQACGTYQPWFQSLALGRHWTIEPDNQPVGNVQVRLYYYDSEFQALQTAANSNANPHDDVLLHTDLDLSKYSNSGNPSVVDGDYVNNCGTGGATTLHQQIANGVGNSVVVTLPVTTRYLTFSIPSFSEFWLGGTNGVSPLPIVLQSFTAECDKGMVKLNWVTASEINNDRFLIHRSANLTEWEEVTTVAGAGNSNAPLSYTAVDNRPLSGLSYYRLTQRDYDGTTESFEPVSIVCYSDGEGNSMLVFPNPAEDKFTVSVNMAFAVNDAELEISDMSGKRIMIRNVNLDKGTTGFTFDRAAMNPGTYFIHLRSDKVVLNPVRLIVK